MTAAAPRAPRSLRRSLASIVLGFELVVVFLATLVNFGLPSGGLITFGPVGALIAGGVLCLLIIIALACLRFAWAIWLGWAIQVLILAGGLFNPVMFFIGAIFAAMWTWSMVRGGRIDAANATHSNDTPFEQGES